MKVKVGDIILVDGGYSFDPAIVYVSTYPYRYKLVGVRILETLQYNVRTEYNRKTEWPYDLKDVKQILVRGKND